MDHPLTKARLAGERCPFQVGNEYLIAVSESDTLKIQVYEVLPETGTGLCKSEDGRKFRAYAYGWSKEALSRLGRVTVPLEWDMEIMVHRDDGMEHLDFHKLEGKEGPR